MFDAAVSGTFEQWDGERSTGSYSDGKLELELQARAHRAPGCLLRCFIPALTAHFY